MNSLSQTPVGELVANDYRTAQVLRSYGIDFCCGGGRTLEKACKSKKVDVQQLAEEL